jgi:hypothetical protein
MVDAYGKLTGRLFDFVFAILRIGYIAKIYNAIVKAIAVKVVDVVVWPLAIVKTPSQPMRTHKLICDTKMQVPLAFDTDRLLI